MIIQADDAICAEKSSQLNSEEKPYYLKKTIIEI